MIQVEAPSDEEQFATFDSTGKPTGLVARSRVHREGLWHRAANVFLFRSDGRLLIQRRQHSKDVWPGAWDVSVAEHLTLGESYEDAAKRGLSEELGVDGIELERLGDVVESRLEVPERGILDNELQQSFSTVFDGPVSANADEVSEVMLVTLEELARAFAESPDLYTPWFRRRFAHLGLPALRAAQRRGAAANFARA